jgi:precorrin-6B methylase 2
MARGWPVVVNVGSGSGYYATGLALRLPAATVHAFEMDDAMRAETARSAARNGAAARVVTHGAATLTALAALPLQAALVVMDCEGAERELLDPAAVPWLTRSAIMVELHDFAAPGTTEILRDRFSATHQVEVVTQAARDAQA